MNQIADETRISKGKIHYLITDWKQKIKLQDIDEIRDFAVLVKKSNISIEQCVQGFRLANILKNLGVEDDNDKSVYIENNDKKSNNNNSRYNEFSTFIQEIYLQCKNLRIAPSNIFSWIKDLLDFHSKSSSDINISTTLFENDDNNRDKKSPSSFIGPSSSQEENESIYYSNFEDKDNSNSKNGPLKEIIIPLISQISYIYLKRKKKIKS